MLCGSAYDSRLAVYDGCDCGLVDGSPIACDDDFCDPGLQSEVDFPGNAGSCYLIRVGGYVSLGGTEYFGQGVLQITIAPPPPTNDLCVDAIPIEVDQLVLGTTTDSTTDEEFNGCDTGFVSYVGVWYSIPGTGTSMTATTCGAGTDFDTKLTVFCGGCEADICVKGNNDYNCTPPPPIEQQSRVVWCSRADEEYLILVHGPIGQFGNFQLEVTANSVACSFPSPCELPLNDDCGNSMEVTDGLTAFDTRLATTDGPEHALCSSSQPQVHQDLWFRYTATCTGNLTVSVCDAGFDTTLAVYAGGECHDLAGTILNCNDDFDCNGNGPDINDTKSQLLIPVACGFEYLIRVGGHAATDAGGGLLDISCDGVRCARPCPEDINNSGEVDVFDVLAALSQWGECSEPCPPHCAADVNDSCAVDVFDLLALLGAWGSCTR